MQRIIAGLWGALALAGVAQADVYVSIDANGSYVLSNVHRPGRHYERVVPEVAGTSVPAEMPQMIADRPFAELVAEAASANVAILNFHAVMRFSNGGAQSMSGGERSASSQPLSYCL